MTRRIHVEHDRLHRRQILRARILAQRALARRGEQAGIFRDVLQIVVLRHRPEAGAAVRFLVPIDRGFAAQDAKHLVRGALLEDVGISEIHASELHLRPS